MEDSQRQVMYDAWARGKKWMRVKVTQNGDEWEAECEHTFGRVYRPTRITAIQKMQSMLAERGYEISNLAELMGVVPERRTFLEWLKIFVWKSITKGSNGLWIEHNKEIPQHKLKDPSGLGGEKEYPSRKLRRILNDLDFNK